MAFEIPGFSFSLEAAVDLSAAQHHFVEVDGSSQLDVVDSSGDAPDGVLQNNPDLQGKAGSIMVNGVSKVVAGAAVAAGAFVMSNGSGRAITATSGNFVAGRALDAGGADGETISVRLGSNHILP